MHHVPERFLQWDRELVTAAGDIRLLAGLAWPQTMANTFLAAWDAGRPELPNPTYQPVDYSASKRVLEDIARQTDEAHPVARYLHATATSYLHAVGMLENLGQPAMTEHSLALYGKPGDRLKGGTITHLDAARHFIVVADGISREFNPAPADFCVRPETVQAELRQAIEPFFTDHPIAVVVDPNLAAKAAAGASRVRLRGATCFTTLDAGQLLQHEIFVHSLTAINGSLQPNLTSMGLGAPRTTATQEGLATFAELVTGVMDLHRIKRIALRILAVDMGLQGADFLDVFRFFLDAGQTKMESYHSAARIFRGGDPRGKVVFTKDGVYLQGLLAAHTFFRWAMHANQLDLIPHLFAGRLTFDDVLNLEPFFQNGTIAAPRYVPPWLTNMGCLGAYLAFAVFANRIDLDVVDDDPRGFNAV